jgi:2-phosphosulfolactate phosphatase
VAFGDDMLTVACEWGVAGTLALRETHEVFVIVDVLSFSTAVDVATSRGGTILPCDMNADAARRLASATVSELAGPRGESRYSLSPASYLELPRGTRRLAERCL